MVKAVLFDLDGTLVDTSEGVAECVSYAAVNLGYPLLPREELLTFIGPPLTLSFPRHYEMDEATTWEAIRLFREHYNAGAMFKAKPYDGILELCQALERRGISMAVATNKVEAQAKRLLAYFGLDRWCSPIRGADPEGRLKKADLIRLCVEELRLSPDQAVLIGDTEFDAEGAEAAGVPFLAVTYGFGFRGPEDTAGRSFLGTADSPMGAAKILLGE